MNKDEMKKAAARAFDLEPGKTVVVKIGDLAIRSDYRCMDKDTEVCDDCRLKFTCYLSQYLFIEGDKLFLKDIGQTINEKVEEYIEGQKPPKTDTKPDS